MTHDTNMQKDKPRAALLIGALGVVYGDIGTSPLYTMKVALSGAGRPDVEHIPGIGPDRQARIGGAARHLT